ncbi:energy transducer TonB [Chryseobacterium sp. MP_3.2]|uniref:energy transducer TonB n=1 Tax=Chryseobacterium sp. MP_3.2 TaxID=3071712 RepID=UPI002DFA9B85|nr:protein TonB [Chryseobacterium sp. MP_3.2]
MKKIILIVFVLCTALAFAQENQPKIFDVTKISNYSYLKTKIDLSDIPLLIDTLPEFPGGINAFRTKVTQKINLFNFNSQGNRRLSTMIYFTIEKDGKMTNVIGVGHIKYSEAVEKGIRKIKDIWEPAKVNGEPVRYLFTLPLSIVFN